MTRFTRTITRAMWMGLLLSMMGSLAPTSGMAQSAADIIDEMDAAHQAMAADVQSFVVETETETNRYERTEQDGRYVYRLSDSGAPTSADEMPMLGFLDDSYIDGLKAAAQYEGTESIDGVETHVLFIEDPSQLESYAELEGQEFQTLKSMRIFVRTEDFMPARFLFEAELPEDAMEGSPFQIEGPITFQVDMRDYRNVDGLLYPFVTEMQNDMMEQMPEEQRQRMEQMQAQMEQQMAQMSEEQREMMQRQMGDQFEQMQAMMRGEPMRTEVTNVTVNE